jgi:hypothetical protein
MDYGILLVHNTLYLSGLYLVIKLVTKDKIISYFSISIYTTVSYLISYMYIKEITLDSIRNLSAMMLSYYIFDIALNDLTNRPHKYIFITHNLTILKLMSLHISGILPLNLGTNLLFIFQLSNLFLLLFRLCNEKRWLNLRNYIAILFVISYITTKLIISPIYSLNYIESISKINNTSLKLHCLILLIFINLNFINNSLVIGSKYYRYIYN